MQFLFKAPAPQQPKPAPDQQQTQPSPSPSPSPTGTPTPPHASLAKPGKGKPDVVKSSCPPPKPAGNEPGPETIVENDLYRITFSNQGALVKHWVLKKYQDDFGKPLDLVNPVTAPVVGYPLSFFTYDKDLQKKLNEVLYVPTPAGPLTAPSSVTFEYCEGDTRARKTFQFDS